MIAETVAGKRIESRSPSSPLTVALLTIGCKLNQAESEAMAGELMQAGCRLVDRAEPADAFVINSCAVTHVAERKSRHLIRLARRLSPDARIVVTGCYAAATTPDVLSALGADAVLHNHEKECASALILGDLPRPDASSNGSARLRTRSFIKIQEGCNDVCAFCVVPQTRGRERSVPAEQILRAVQSAEANSVKEVVLTGTQLGAYGRDASDGIDLLKMISLVLERTSVPRVRLSSVQPQDITPALLDLWDDPRLCRHFHIALQSGSDDVLTRMRRRYTTRQFAEALAAIRRKLPDAAVTTDVLVGFPGECEADFETTRRFCREAEFAALHVFPFSSRPGTLAARMPDQVRAQEKRERVQEMLALGEELRTSFLSRYEGGTVEVLFEKAVSRACGRPLWEGLTGNYIRVLAPADEPLENRIVAVKLGERYRSDLLGEPVRIESS
ncbi:MAG: tRNA (N(6)-L-threonylcarbamoyladenosine(37)-C(2))-methylthiotransferase MtaB [Dehalococcoidia bacterium]